MQRVVYLRKEASDVARKKLSVQKFFVQVTFKRCTVPPLLWEENNLPFKAPSSVREEEQHGRLGEVAHYGSAGEHCPCEIREAVPDEPPRRAAVGPRRRHLQGGETLWHPPRGSDNDPATPRAEPHMFWRGATFLKEITD